MKANKLEDFIKNYVNNKLISEGDAAYESWRRKGGTDTAGALARELTRADTLYKKSAESYGKSGERLGSLGLTKSGYAAFLGDGRERALEKSIAAADAAYSDSESKNRKGYSAYIKSESDSTEKRIKEAKSNLLSSGMTDYNAAYNAAIEMGIPQDEAKSIAKQSTDKAIREARLKVISAIVNKRFGGAQAREYATALGLSGELAEELYELAEATNREIDLGNAEGYLEYLKTLAAKNAGE